MMSLILNLSFLIFMISIGNARDNLRSRLSKPVNTDYNENGIIITFDPLCNIEISQKIAVIQELFPCITRRGDIHLLENEQFIVGDIDHIDDSCLNNDINFNDVCIKSIEYEPVVNLTSVCQKQNLLNGLPLGYSWSLDKLDKIVDNQYTYLYEDNSNVDIYILDTGVQANHVEFSGRIVNLDPSYPTCTASHGTHVAGTTGGNNYGVSRNLMIYTYNVCRYTYTTGEPGCGSGDIFNALAAVLARLQSTNRKGVINLSLGSKSPTYTSIDAKYDNYFQKLLLKQGIPVVAAGNDNIDACNFSPAKSNYAITVGSYGKFGQKSSWSNYGSCVDVWGPGELIPSSIWQSDSNNNKYGIMSGTSMAAPHITGLVANILSLNNNINKDQILNELKSNSFSVNGCVSGSVCKGSYYDCELLVNNVNLADQTNSTATTTKSPTTKSPTTKLPTTKSPTKKPTTKLPTRSPTKKPTTKSPTKKPTTKAPTKKPTTKSPTKKPTTKSPTKKPTTKSPTKKPTTKSPTKLPTVLPSSSMSNIESTFI